MQRKKYRLADSSHKDFDLRTFKQIILTTVEAAVPGKHPKVEKSFFSTDPLTQSEAVALGRALSKVEQLSRLGKTVTTFRLFYGRMYESETATTPIQKSKEV